MPSYRVQAPAVLLFNIEGATEAEAQEKAETFLRDLAEEWPINAEYLNREGKGEEYDAEELCGRHGAGAVFYTADFEELEIVDRTDDDQEQRDGAFLFAQAEKGDK